MFDCKVSSTCTLGTHTIFSFFFSPNGFVSSGLRVIQLAFGKPALPLAFMTSNRPAHSKGPHDRVQHQWLHYGKVLRSPPGCTASSIPIHSQLFFVSIIELDCTLRLRLSLTQNFFPFENYSGFQCCMYLYHSTDL